VTRNNWFASQACRHGELDVDIIDLAQTWLPDVLTCDGSTPLPPVQDLAPWLAAADAFVIVTPEYNHSFPASLKNAIDWYGDVWKTKPVGFVSYGGRAAGLRAVEALKPVFTELHAVSVRETVSFHDHPRQFDAGGRPTDPDACNAAARTCSTSSSGGHSRCGMLAPNVRTTTEPYSGRRNTDSARDAQRPTAKAPQSRGASNCRSRPVTPSSAPTGRTWHSRATRPPWVRVSQSIARHLRSRRFR
jgi:NAD(P)H-dependent FMN reductase